jgi:hypothetical protein
LFAGPWRAKLGHLLINRAAKSEYVRRTMKVKFVLRRTIKKRLPRRDHDPFPRQFDHAAARTKTGARPLSRSARIFTLLGFSLWRHGLAAQKSQLAPSH